MDIKWCCPHQNDVYIVRERCKKTRKKKLTSVSFALTHTYTPVKTNIFPFFPQAYMENFEKCAKTQKLKQKIYFPMLPVVVSFLPYFFEPFPNVIFNVQNLYSERELSKNLNYCRGKKGEKK